MVTKEELLNAINERLNYSAKMADIAPILKLKPSSLYTAMSKFQTDGTINPVLLTKLKANLGINPDWVLTGNGPKFLDNQEIDKEEELYSTLSKKGLLAKIEALTTENQIYRQLLASRSRDIEEMTEVVTRLIHKVNAMLQD